LYPFKRHIVVTLIKSRNVTTKQGRACSGLEVNGEIESSVHVFDRRELSTFQEVSLKTAAPYNCSSFFLHPVVLLCMTAVNNKNHCNPLLMQAFFSSHLRSIR